MKKIKKAKRWDRKWEPYLLLSPALLIVLVVMGYPLLYSVRRISAFLRRGRTCG